jgi:hypothetical protein
MDRQEWRVAHEGSRTWKLNAAVERERERTMGLCLVAAKGGGRDVIM